MACSWTFLWLLWIALVAVLLFALRGPLKISESLESVTATSYFNNLTPKFYVALTGTSSLVSGIILIFEWWYFKNNAGIDAGDEEGSDNDESIENTKTVPECKVWRNPMALFRAAEYNRFRKETNSEPLTYYDMNLSAQDHQSLFMCDEDQGRAEYEIMQVAWRERESEERIQTARAALAINPECASALVLLAEEESETVSQAENLLRRALRAIESTLNSYSNNQIASYAQNGDAVRKRDLTIQTYIKRRLAMCARKQGRLREAIKGFRDLSRDQSLSTLLSVQDNLIEACLEVQAYADVQNLLVRYDGYGAPCSYELREPRSAAMSYTSALLKVRAVAENFRCAADSSIRRGLSSAEQTAIEALTRAMEFNPHVPPYLLELRSMIMPPEHFLKRGDSEALAYAFFHIQHWKRIDGALQLLSIVWKDFVPKVSKDKNAFSSQLESADKELLPSWHEQSVFPKTEGTLMMLLQTFICLAICILAVLAQQFPASSGEIFRTAATIGMQFYENSVYTVSQWAPGNIIPYLASKQVPVPEL
ncbi:Protein ST7 homolog [Caenorhabditis elegans]|uniref:Protein ST7 homolog n=1 Tax=Caenorhabditis elegans TaxID=6239 RepID=ST7_CAEEL|nr:Protein ST7 homolog [Caenorhabditis elegans]Q19337.1 RecName: Full=Protein ST7 homolog [Caenorhabditis elegans]CAA92595.1 Protein ST7 homolog [Caenorhabditis elegans]|eukprot:NP_502294.1 Protein ST7 homolog [Caenorhabditis elegans]